MSKLRVQISFVFVFLLVISIASQGFVPTTNAQMATKSTTSVGFVQIDRTEYDVSYTTTAIVKVNGTILSPNAGDSKIAVLFKLPDGSTKGSEVAMLPNGYFESSLGVDSNSQKGTYSVMVSYSNNLVGSVFFSVKQVAAKSILSQIANQTISKPVTTQNDVKTSPSTSSSNVSQLPTPPSSGTIDVTKPSKLPSWVKRIFVWYGQGQVSEDEVIGAVEYMVQNGIIKVKTSNVSSPSQTPSTQQPSPSPTPQSSPSTTSQSTSSNNGILTNSGFTTVQNDPDTYVDQWAKLTGFFTQDPLVQDGSNWVVFDYSQGGSSDPNKEVWFTYNDPSLNVKSDDCAIAEGHIKGKSKMQYSFTGASHDAPWISLEKITKISCLEAKYPPTKTINVGQSQTQGSMKVTIDKVEISDYNTRIYGKVENLGNSDGINFYGGTIVQGQKQYDSTFGPYGITEKSLNYATNIQSGVVYEGVLFFEPIVNQPFQLMLKGYDSGTLQTINSYSISHHKNF